MPACLLACCCRLLLLLLLHCCSRWWCCCRRLLLMMMPGAAAAALLQVVVPDVQKLINQSGIVCSDIFTTCLIKPPHGVLLVSRGTRRGKGEGNHGRDLTSVMRVSSWLFG